VPITRPGRRIITAEDVVKEQVEAFETPTTPPQTKVDVEAVRNLTYSDRLKRRLRMADMALEKYEKKLERGLNLEPEEERLFLAHQDSVRKLETTLMQLEHKDERAETKTDLELAVDLYMTGWSYQDIIRLFKHNQELPKQLEKAIEEAIKNE
jgi:hypothetical protein